LNKLERSEIGEGNTPESPLQADDPNADGHDQMLSIDEKLADRILIRLLLKNLVKS
jgi:hypothetical protein